MKYLLLALCLLLAACSPQPRFQVLQQGYPSNAASPEHLTVVYDNQRQQFIVIEAGGTVMQHYPTKVIGD